MEGFGTAVRSDGFSIYSVGDCYVWFLVLILCFLFLQAQILLIVLYMSRSIPQIVRDEKRLPKPKRPKVLNISGGEMDKYTYRIELPAAGAHDVVFREIHCVANGVESVEVVDAAVTHHEIVFEENADCVLWLIDIDDAGNRSPEGEKLNFRVVDVVPPSAPGAPVISDVVLYEEPAEPVVEEPVAEEPVAEEPVAEEPVAEEPVAEEPVAEEPVAEEPATEEPATEEPATEEPVAEEPVAEEPATEEPATEEPATEEPATEEPVAEEKRPSA